jgi:endonuclease/exonuclease/phosphatase family metal-dependent hydrolase
MQVLSLNIWGGHQHKELLEFIQELNGKVDIICLQEVFKSAVNTFSSGSKMNIYSDLEKTLKDYQIFYAPTFANYDLKTIIDFDALFGEATYVKKSIEVISEGTVFTYKHFDEKKMLFRDDSGEYWDLPRNFHYVIIRNRGKKFLIANLHGFWKPGDKEDTKESLKQSDKILEFLKTFNGPRILCGDFNLNPQTESIKKLERSGLINLIRKYNITNTRSKLHTRKEKFADYIFVSPEVKVNEFKVLDKHISDHLPLYLKFE